MLEAEKIQKNYEKHLKIIDTYLGERANSCKEMLNHMEDTYVMAPASGKTWFHNAFAGGYVDHVNRVVEYSIKQMRLYKEMGGEVDFTDEELLFAAFHHDLGKLGTRENGPLYKAETSDWHRKNQNSMFKHNGELHFMDVTHRALWLLNQYDIKYNEKEMLGIMLADGLYNDATKPYFISYREEFRLKTDLPYVLHWADHMSCRQENKEWEDSKPF